MISEDDDDDCIWKSFLTRGRKLTFHNELRQGRDWTKCVAYTYSFTLRHEINKFRIFPVDVYRIVNVFSFQHFGFPFSIFCFASNSSTNRCVFYFWFNKVKKRLGFPNIDNTYRIYPWFLYFDLLHTLKCVYTYLKANYWGLIHLKVV
jgi:hypothetical protein